MVLAGLFDQAAARRYAGHRVLDQALDFLGRGGRAVRQVAHFAGHHRKAAALLAGARRFHRRVQGQDIGLEGDAVDDADDVGDLARRRVMSCMVPTTCSTTAPPRSATPDAACASRLAWRALSAFCLTVEVSSSIDAAVSSSELACCSVRLERSWLPAAICWLAVPIASVPLRTWVTMPTSEVFIRVFLLQRGQQLADLVLEPARPRVAGDADQRHDADGQQQRKQAAEHQGDACADFHVVEHFTFQMKWCRRGTGPLGRGRQA
jgi:hypothetical protein